LLDIDDKYGGFHGCLASRPRRLHEVGRHFAAAKSAV
jgi:hypothetical protein